MTSKYTGEKRKNKFDSQYVHVPLVQSSPTECGVSECNREALIMRRPWPTEGVAPWKNNIHALHISSALKETVAPC
jgi:hypothetical protein